MPRKTIQLPDPVVSATTIAGRLLIDQRDLTSWLRDVSRLLKDDGSDLDDVVDQLATCISGWKVDPSS